MLNPDKILTKRFGEGFRSFALFLTSAGLLLTAAGGLAAPHVGEDGKTYQVDDSAIRADWLFGKIEPAVLEAAKGSTTINVAIHVARPAPARNATDPVLVIKDRYRPQFEQLSEQMRQIWQKSRPSGSLDAEQEREFMLAKGLSVSNEDRAALLELQYEHDNLRTAMHKEVGAALHAAGLAERREMSDFIAAIGGQVNAEVAVLNLVAATVPSDSILALARHRLVTTVALDLDTRYELDNSVPSAGYDDWHNAADGPFVGGAYDVGLVDSGVQQDHPGFSNVNIFYSNSPGTDSDGHGTHVAGIVTNNDTTYIYGGPYTGTATDLDAFIWKLAASTQAATMARMDDLMTDFAQTPEVVNHSLGYAFDGSTPSTTVDSNDYVANDSFYDAFVRNYDIQVTKSAGNNGWGTDATMTFPANAHNIIVVANMNDRGTFSRADDVRSSSSSVGPTLNGRRKPDIAAPGSSIQSTNAFHAGFGDTPGSGCSSSNNTDICTKSGTSMAAPHIAGAIVLQHDGGNLDAQAQKAVLLNTADWWTSNNTSSTIDDGLVSSQTCPGTGFDPCDTPWDRSYGWGYVDMAEALFNRSDYFVGSVVPRNDNATADDYKLYTGLMFANEKATLTWEKRHTTYVAGGPSTGQHTLADINIRLYNNSGAYVDGDFVGNDNVHQVAASSGGTAVIKVYAWSLSFAGASSETYWLATEENFSTALPPSFSAVPLIPLVGPFQTFTAPTQVTNNGGVPAHATNVTIGSIAGVIGGGASLNVGTIAAGSTEQADFTLTTSGLGPGTYLIGATIQSNSYDETYSNTSAGAVRFVVETTPPTSNCMITPLATNSANVSIPWTASDGVFGTGVALARLYVVTPGSPSFVYTGLTQNGSSGTFNYARSAGDGTYRFAIRARDIGGNWEAVPGSTECLGQLDSVAPSSSVSTPMFDAGGAIPLTWSATDAAPSSGLEFVDFWYWAEPAGPWTFTGLFSSANNGVLNWVPPGPGVYHFNSRAKDIAQNIEPGTFALPPADSVTNYGAVDSDGDGVLDLADNCRLVANADQRDTDGDSIGNVCDPDVDGAPNCFVNFLDLEVYRTNFFMLGDLDTDNNGDGITNFLDLNVIRNFFFGPPGPGALGACN